MIREIKKKQSKFGTIISSYVEGVDPKDALQNLESMNAYAAYVTIHMIGRTHEGPNGIHYVGTRGTPKLKQAIGHQIQAIRGDQLVGFVNPLVKFNQDISGVYTFADNNRMERAFGFFLGDLDHPNVVAFAGSIIPHLFHAVPDALDMSGEAWLKYLHEWAPKAMMRHRYFDANEHCSTSLVVQEPPVIKDHPILKYFKKK